MDWYDKLSTYFPDHEMKPAQQMTELAQHHEAYRIHETEDHVVTYAEFKDFLFIDYLLVNPNTRGKGIGGKLLETFKQKGKPIILEVEPADSDESDTVKRVKFYERHGFKKAEHIEYTRSDDDGTPYTMDIYYWPPEGIQEQTILRNMATVCREIHNFRSLKYYGRLIADPDEVLNWLQ